MTRLDSAITTFAKTLQQPAVIGRLFAFDKFVKMDYKGWRLIEENGMTRKPDIKIGDKFFMFDENRRVYERDANGRAVGGPTFRGHFFEVSIEGENSKSWITQNGRTKIPKASPFPPLYTPDMIDDSEWRGVHAYGIARDVQHTKDVDILRKVAEIIGYDAEGRS